MLKSLLVRYPLILLSCFYIGLAHAYPEPTNDPLEAYRDQIKQSESNASKAVLDALQANDESDSASQQNQPVVPNLSEAPTPRSNTDKAFTPTDNNTPANSTHSSNKNPWLQPNPWAKQRPNLWEKNAKVNPYANAPIPGPTPPNVSTNAAIPNPPNIFAPPRQPSSPNNPRPNATS
jgi:hypothetical protein